MLINKFEYTFYIKTVETNMYSFSLFNNVELFMI